MSSAPPLDLTQVRVKRTAAVEVAERMEVELTLRNGTSAVGGLIERKLTFRPHGK